VKKLLVCLLLTAGMWSAAFAQSAQAKFLEVTGTVEIKEAGSPDWKPAAPGDPIGKDTVVSTGFKSTALISLGNSNLAVRPLTRLTLEELERQGGTERAALYLNTGRVRAEVTPPAGGKVDFTIKSPSITASVRGTAFEFDTKHLKVDKGSIRLSNAKGQRVYVGEGQRSYINEAEQRVVPPFEAENELLRPELPELTNTNSAAQGPASVPGLSPADVTVRWP
jgi:hypothetical protein